MPLPKVRKNEEKQTFISRCAEDSVMNKEFPDNSQRLGVCYNIWDRRKKENKGEKIEWKPLDKEGFLLI